jgi:hypothetical protein
MEKIHRETVNRILRKFIVQRPTKYREHSNEMPEKLWRTRDKTLGKFNVRRLKNIGKIHHETPKKSRKSNMRRPIIYRDNSPLVDASRWIGGGAKNVSVRRGISVAPAEIRIRNL